MAEFKSLGMETPPEDLEALRCLVAEALNRNVSRPWNIVEVGTWTGRTALAILGGYFRSCSSAKGMIWCVDTWRGSPGDVTEELVQKYGGKNVYEAFCQNMGNRLLRQVVPLVGESVFWARNWPATTPIDLVFLDGDHSAAAVKADIEAWWPRVRSGGILCGHDFHFPGVFPVVNELLPGFRRVGNSIWYKVKE